MNFKDTAVTFVMLALNLALFFIFCGLVAHLVWYLVTCGWGLI